MICTREVKPRSTTTFVVILAVVLINHRRVSVDSIIVQGPSDKIAIVNKSTFFNCSTTIKPVDDGSISWFHFPLEGGGQRHYVYKDGRIMTNYRNRFTIETDLSSGTINLLALRLDSKDAGRYECTDDIVDGQGASAELTVLAADPTCHSSLIRDGKSCGIDPDEVKLSCSVTYHGNIPIQLEWWMTGGNYPITNTASFKSGNSVTCNATLKTDLAMNNQSYVCQTRSITSQFKCNSEIIRLQYIFNGTETVNKTIGEEIKCAANSSQSCSYKWKWFNEYDSVTVSTNQTLKPTSVGTHLCEATCPIGNTHCVVDVMFAEVGSHSTEDNSAEQESCPFCRIKDVVLCSLLSAIAIIAGLVITFVVCRRRRRTASQKPEAPKPEDSTEPLVSEHKHQGKQSDAEPN